MHYQRTDAARFASPNATAIEPFLFAIVAEDVAPIFLFCRVLNGRIEFAFINQHRVIDVTARRTGPAAIFPIAEFGVVDAETNMTIVSRTLVAAAAGIHTDGKSLAPRRIIKIENVTDD